MSTTEEIKHQQTLLATHRRTLGILLQQRAALGAAYTPPGTINGIMEARNHIARIKGTLQLWGVPAADDPDDEEPPQPSVAANLAQPHGATTINVYGPIHSGNTQFGGQQQIDRIEASMGDKYDFSGAQISGSNINVGSTLTNVTQSIGAIPSASAEDKQKLEELVGQLQALLQQVPPAQSADAEKVANRTKAMVEEVKQTNPDKEFVEINAESLKKAAANLAAVVPAVLPIATQIANHILGLLK